MATRALVQSGLTASRKEFLPFAVKWDVIRVSLFMHSGSTAGNRHLYARISDSIMNGLVSSDGGYGITLADTGTVTTVSGITVAIGGYSADGAGSSLYTSWYGKMIVGQMSEIDIEFTGQSGDTYDYFIEVDEVPDI